MGYVDTPDIPTAFLHPPESLQESSYFRWKVLGITLVSRWPWGSPDGTFQGFGVGPSVSWLHIAYLLSRNASGEWAIRVSDLLDGISDLDPSLVCAAYPTLMRNVQESFTS